MTVSAFNPIAERLSASPFAVPENEALRSLWETGEDGWLREDPRFRPTPAGQWILSDRYLVNDLLVRSLREEGISELVLSEQLVTLAQVVGHPTAVCTRDQRLRFDEDRVRLAPSELTAEPLLENIEPLFQYITHLPVLSLKAAAASEPAGEWGPSAEPQEVVPRGWLRVDHIGRPLNRRMFVAQVKGHSMDDGRTGLEDKSWAIFEFVFHEGATYDSGLDRPIILVRGEFTDPELGTYAVKRWARDDPAVRLVSANPDKERYPDIVVPREAADHLRIIATVTKALRTSDFARRPKPRRLAGRRILDGMDGLDEVGKRLERRLATFFEGAPSEEGEEESPTTGWRSRLICLDLDSGGLHLEIGPLEGLPPFAKKLRVVGASGHDGLLVASNARQRPGRVPVSPDSGPWRWEAVGFEEEGGDLGMDRLAHDRLPDDDVVLFRVDAMGIGQSLQGHVLSPGQHYRILLSPGCLQAIKGELPGSPLPGEWRLWDLQLGMDIPVPVRELLDALGVQVGEPQPRLDWALHPPTSWRHTARGEAYAVFRSATNPVVRALGFNIAGEQPTVLFLRGNDSIERLPLPIEGETLVRLSDLAPGRWACALLHPRVEVQPSSLLFEVEDGPISCPSASWRVEIRDAGAARGRAGERDLSVLLGDADAMEVFTPPCWQVMVRWRHLSDEVVAKVHADETGHVDLSGILPLLQARARRLRIGDAVLDVGELGYQDIRHRKRHDAIVLRQQMAEHFASRRTSLAARPGAWLALFPLWFEPILGMLGYGSEPLGGDSLAERDISLAAWRLSVDERRGERIRRTASRVLVATTDLARTLDEELDWLDEACELADVREAIVTDGLRWALHRKENEYHGESIDLTDALKDDGAFQMLLAAFAEGRR